MAPLEGKLVLFEGAAMQWAWDGTVWSPLTSSGPTPAGGTFGSALAPLGGELVLLAGSDVNYVPENPATWTWNGLRWTPILTGDPPRRVSAGLSPLGGQLLLFGGEDLTAEANNVDPEAVLGDTWQWDGSSWTQLDVVGPSARSTFGMAPF
jgi:hypothetical protein